MISLSVEDNQRGLEIIPWKPNPFEAALISGPKKSCDLREIPLLELERDRVYTTSNTGDRWWWKGHLVAVKTVKHCIVKRQGNAKFPSSPVG